MFKVISKDLTLDDPSFGDGFQSFAALGYSESDYRGKLYSLVIADILLPQSKEIS
jgi:hypothetical protein